MSTLSKKQAQQIARLINSCALAQVAINIERNRAERDLARMQRLMQDHDTDGAELNAILGQTAIILFSSYTPAPESLEWEPNPDLYYSSGPYGEQ